LQRYEKLRRPRVMQLQRSARQSGRIYHLSGPLALARNLVIKTMGPKRMLSRQDWIYNWQA
jgi:salicylate hydroxylase